MLCGICHMPQSPWRHSIGLVQHYLIKSQDRSAQVGWLYEWQFCFLCRYPEVEVWYSCCSCEPNKSTHPGHKPSEPCGPWDRACVWWRLLPNLDGVASALDSVDTHKCCGWVRTRTEPCLCFWEGVSSVLMFTSPSSVDSLPQACTWTAIVFTTVSHFWSQEHWEPRVMYKWLSSSWQSHTAPARTLLRRPSPSARWRTSRMPLSTRCRWSAVGVGRGGTDRHLDSAKLFLFQSCKPQCI